MGGGTVSTTETTEESKGPHKTVKSKVSETKERDANEGKTS